jgi:hypothetical protein
MNPRARRIVVGTGEVRIDWWYEFVLYGGGGVGVSIRCFHPMASFQLAHECACSIFSVAGYGVVMSMGSTSVKAIVVRS